ncbi:MAG: hypothetical protein L3K15_08220 [Thermoplasmata archaeon]|nr:hypothetical protein [Thermoplasmata archaeon]
MTATMTVQWKADPVGPGGTLRPAGRMADSTADAELILLRGFLRGAGNPIHLAKLVWRHQRGDPSRRRWFDA